MGPRGRTVGWIREEHSENGRANEEELWTWQAATQTLHLNGTAMHGRLKSWNSWAEESREESVVSSEGSGGAVVTQGLVSRSVTSGNESSVYASDSSQNGALRSSQNGASGSSNGVSKLAGNENGYAGSVQAENGRAGREALGGGQSTSDSEGAVAGAHSENEAGSKKKLKKDGKKAKKAAKAALENVKKKGKKKKGKGVALEESVMEVAQTSEAEAADKPPSSFVHVNGVRMYPGPGYVDRMESKFSDVLTSLSEAVKLDKQTDRAAAVAEQPSQNGAAKTEPPAENLEERLRDLRRKAIEHKARHDGEKGTLVVPTKQPILVLMRHGQSMWNELKLFTGDVDIPLTEKGVMEALSGGRTIKDVDFDIVFTSRLLRAKQTAMLALTQNSSHVVPVLVRGGYYGNGRIGDGNRLRLREAAMYALDKAACKMVPVFAHPALNERCYGDLQGLNKEEAAKEFGKELVQQWRRSNDTSPPGGESLVDTARRARKYYVEVIEPRLREGKNVLVVTHGNVMRGLIAHLANLEEEEMLTLEISTAFPYAYAFSRESDAYAQCCLMKPMEDFITGEPLEDKPMGLASVLKKKNFDSLI
ncbi:phosphoglycerate mutase [Klebsormidium nitens]|uniref:phosphoglycerate mutase (2,3-diphosphoglycerate-dependent) n=1 Tax=Klebsormidium nitens TaxID=105231 RepID=A0A1Y1IVB2_KLENI|nr:phosphoglycerate mutase [Klebsormidium nitens]|eukprot:GAQ92796.1 phosphoglycerate mutase [Klebsormidium nitens]